jgi:predicted MFS family arabinose efflux permease
VTVVDATTDGTGGNRSYRDVLRDRPLAGLLAGDLLANVGTGMLVVAMPVETLRIRGSVPAALAIGMVAAAPFVVATVVALAVGLGRVRAAPQTLLLADCVLRAVWFGLLGSLAVTGRLTFPVLVGGLLAGAAGRMAGSSSRRVLATSLAGERDRFAVNGLLGLNGNVGLYVLGPVVGGIVVVAVGAGAALFADACGAVLVLAAVLRAVPRRVAVRQDRRRSPSGWRILRRRPVAARLLVVVFFFNLLYMPIEVALPLHVRGDLHAGAAALGLLWAALGAGAATGAALTNQLRNLPQRHLLIAIIGLWGLCPVALAATSNLTVALVVFGLGGLVWAPFNPVAYSFMQSGLAPDEQQQVVALWTAGATLAAPLGLAAGGPLIRSPARTAAWCCPAC